MQRNILIFSPDTFGYYKIIIGCLEDMGHKVTWLNNVPSANLLTKIIFRRLPKAARWYSARYFKKHIAWDQNYHNIIVIKGEGVDKSIISQLRNHYVNSCMTLYNWDSIENNPTFLEKTPYFDKVFTFDFLDAKKYQNLIYLSLFYADIFNEKKKSSCINKYSGLFVGTVHSNRYEIVESITQKLESITKKKSFTHYFYPSKLLYKILVPIRKDIGAAKGKIKFQSLTQKEISKLMGESDVIIDIVHERQSGLTMRTIEAIGGRKKIITNNKYIAETDFFHENNIYIIKNVFLDGLDEFINKEYAELDEKIYRKLSIKGWLTNLL